MDMHSSKRCWLKKGDPIFCFCSSGIFFFFQIEFYILFHGLKYIQRIIISSERRIVQDRFFSYTLNYISLSICISSYKNH